MAGHKSFQDKVYDLLSPNFICSRLQSDESLNNTVIVHPFTTRLVDILIGKRDDGFFEVGTHVLITQQVQKKWGETDDDYKDKFIQLLESTYFRHMQDVFIDDEFAFIISTRVFQIQNMRNQEILNLVQNNTVLLKEVSSILYKIYDSLNMDKSVYKDYDMSR